MARIAIGQPKAIKHNTQPSQRDNLNLTIDAVELIAVTVTFHPELDLLRAQLSALPPECLKVIVDNASTNEARQSMHDLCSDIPFLLIVENSENVGLASALNRGARLGRKLRPTARWCLLLDQDSEPQAGCVDALFEGLELLAQRGERVGCVGPLLIDVKTGLPHGFHQMTKWRWRRVYPTAADKTPISCTNLNGSGTLVSLDLFLELGGLDESMFIDHVDTEWSFRLLAQGYTLWGIPNAVFQHRMGENSLRYWMFGWHIWPSRSPTRHRYLFRNATWLMQRNYVPLLWKFWAGVKLTLTVILHVFFDPKRNAQLRAIVQGLGESVIKVPHD